MNARIACAGSACALMLVAACVTGCVQKAPPPEPPASPANPPVTTNTPTQPPNSGPTWPTDVVEIATPPPNFHWAIPWCEAVCDTRRRDVVGTVSIKYLRLYAQFNGSDYLIIDQSFADVMCGGLYIRSPWFGYGTSQAGTYEPMPYTIQSGYGTVEPSDQQDKVYHWYSCGRSFLPAAPGKVWVEAQLKITGSACFQLGWDYWDADENGNAQEGGSTRWYYDSDCPDWTVITLGR